MDISQKEWRDIGGEFVFEQLNTMTPYGTQRKALRKQYRPSQREELLEELSAVEELSQSLQRHPSAIHNLQYEFCRVKDIRRSVQRAKKGGILEDLEFFELKIFCDVIYQLIEKYPLLDTPLESGLLPLDEIRERLDPEKTGRMTFYVYDAYSKRLTLLRKHQREIEVRIAREKDEQEKEELLRERGGLLIAQDKEEREIRIELSSLVQMHADVIFHNMDALGRLDHRIAKAILAKEYGGCMPQVREDGGIELKEAINPLLSDILSKKGENFQRMSIKVPTGTSIVTGANMGGKSVSLKTMLLNVMLVHMGMFPFAEAATISLFDFFFYLGDDLEDLSAGLSSFGAEILKLSDVYRKAQHQRGMILLDEPLRGTNPREGRAILLGLVRRFVGSDHLLVVSTHFESLVEEGMTHFQVRGLKDVDFDALASEIEVDREASLSRIRKSMNFRLEEVEAGEDVPRDALRISELLGLDPTLIEEIKELL